MTLNDTQFAKRLIYSIGFTVLLLAAGAFLPMNFSAQKIDVSNATDAVITKDISLITLHKKQVIKSPPKEIEPAPKKIINNTNVQTIPTIAEPKQTEKIATEEAITEKVETQEIVEREISEEEIVHEQIESQAAENYDTDIFTEQATGNTTATSATASASHISPASDDVSKNALSKYKQYAVSRIAANKSYPLKSRAKSEEGVVRVFVIIASDGSLQKAVITETCDFSALNEAALMAVKKSSPFKNLEKELTKKQYRLNVSWNSELKFEKSQLIQQQKIFQLDVTHHARRIIYVVICD